MNPPTKHRFFFFILQHYRGRVQDIFRRAGATPEEYYQAMDYFDNRGGAHFNRPNRRDLHEMRITPQTEEERERSLHFIRGLPEIHQRSKTLPIVENDEKYESYEYPEGRGAHSVPVLVPVRH
eukprot:4148563-Amphidinium_carterae.1